MSPRTGRAASIRLAAIGLLVLATLGLSPSVDGATSDPAPATESAMRAHLLDRLNGDRVAAGLVPLRGDALLLSVAERRAGRMAAAAVLDHGVAGGDITAAVNATGLRWYGIAEDIGYTTDTWGTGSVDWIYGAWQASDEHREIMMDGRMNYVGVGLARSPSGATYASLVFAETDDRTAPTSRMTSARLADRTATFTWAGHDVALQSHTAGLAGFDVGYRIDGGGWRIIRDATTATSLVLPDRRPGHAYAVRVRCRDGAGNVSQWSRALRVVVH